MFHSLRDILIQNLKNMNINFFNLPSVLWKVCTNLHTKLYQIDLLDGPSSGLKNWVLQSAPTVNLFLFISIRISPINAQLLVPYSKYSLPPSLSLWSSQSFNNRNVLKRTQWKTKFPSEQNRELTKTVLTFPQLDQILDRVLSASRSLTSLSLEHLLQKTCNFKLFSVPLRCRSFLKASCQFHSPGLFLRDLRAIPLKYNYQ